MSRIAIVADTHVPSRATGVPDWIADEIERSDHTIHAGDFDSVQTYERVRELTGGDLTSVRGNMDPPTLEVPSVATLEIEGTTFVVTHGTGSPDGWHQRVASTAREEAGPDAIAVAGHTHEIVDTTIDGIRVLNPGSATGASPADRETMLVATVDDGDVTVETLTG
ncbi:YfcE family phosphodiesterase [Natronococcus pandeyae]|uniref:Phosphoesterase n=1 Tax=Natronococcus pandeyae TaxID=2055836 RepID=A0A8J8Q3U1_9EURY|nr:metallophosphoesterase family protein [Natronococcus pandeyae]TYL38307.1 YfcE family phosphodiesterase [Natronococcus pandeyae]